VWRRSEEGRYRGDLISLDSETAEGEPLLSEAMEGGTRIRDAAGAGEAARRCRDGVGSLPERLRSLSPADAPYPVEITGILRDLASRLGREPLDWPPDHPNPG
jgi:nicotinate phosphoribosyltransferase